MSNLGDKKSYNKHNQTMKTCKTEDGVIKVKCLKITVLFGRKFDYLDIRLTMHVKM